MTKFLKGECAECRGHIEFPAEATGTTTDCPHCGRPTELLLAVPVQESSVPTKTIVFSIIAILILLGGLVGAMIALKRAQRVAAQKQEAQAKANAQNPAKPVNPFADIGFEASPVKVEKAAGSTLTYATGTIRNLANSQRFGVRVELDLLNEGGSKIGEAKDYQAVIEPNAPWRFQAQVLEKKAAGARVVSIKEDK